MKNSQDNLQPLRELIEKKKVAFANLEEADPGFLNGIKKLLTYLYPDKAHFIFELLQNAEDMDATEVNFYLSGDCLWFEHNGKKRNFDLDDIRAITSIHDNVTKQDDKTAIGKFGIGFKAVYAYTETPEIHSGSFHFSIHNQFIPSLDAPTDVPTIDDKGVSWTKFKFPFFESESKSKKQAFDQIRSGLFDLDENAILFLRNINKIYFEVENGSRKEEGYIEKVKCNDVVTRIDVINSDGKERFANYIIYNKEIVHFDENNKEKMMKLGVAYALEHKEDGKWKMIIPQCGGKTFIYFPASSEKPGLNFHVNAPFASTVARDVARRDCADNGALMDELSNVVAESLIYIKNIGDPLLLLDLRGILPSASDQIDEFYVPIRNKVNAAYQKEKLLPTVDGAFIDSVHAIMANKTVTDVLDDDFLAAAESNKFKWILPPLHGSRAEVFLSGIGVKRTTIDWFFNEGDQDTRFQIEAELARRDTNWLIRFFEECQQEYNRRYDEDYGYNYDDDEYTGSESRIKDFNKYGSYTRLSIAMHLRLMRSVRSVSGDMHRPDKLVIPCADAKYTLPVNMADDAIIKHQYRRGKKTYYLRDFLINDLSIRICNEKYLVERILEAYSASRPDSNSDAYFSDLMFFAEYAKKHPDSSDKEFVDFSKENIFLYTPVQSKGDILNRVYDHSSYLPKVYGDPTWSKIVDVISKSNTTAYLLWEGYAEKLPAKDLQTFIDFAVSHGIKRELTIDSVPATGNRLFSTHLSTEGGWSEMYGVSVDYVIKYINKLLNMHDREISLYILKLLLKSRISWYEAVYCPNSRALRNTCESTLLQNLKSFNWLPDKNGVFFNPTRITMDQLDEEFVPYVAPYAHVLRVGANIDKGKTNQPKQYVESYNDLKQQRDDLKKERDDLEKKVKEQADLIEKLQAKKRPAPRPSPDLTRDGVNGETGDADEHDGGGAVHNPTTRAQYFEGAFDDSSGVPQQIQRRAQLQVLNAEQRTRVGQYYKGKCQICGTKIIKADGSGPHFVGLSIFKVDKQDPLYASSLRTAWNTLCLCPNCAARWQYCTRHVEDMEREVMQLVDADDDERIPFHITLGGRPEVVKFAPDHFLAFQTGYKVLLTERKF